MSTRADVTVNSVARTYTPNWHALYAGAIGNGDTSCETVDITDGESIIRRTHSVSKQGVEKHYESVEDIIKDENGVTHKVKVGVTITYESNDPSEETRAKLLAEGYLANVGSSTELASLTSGELRK
jgi:hypothetical protein